MFQSTASNNVYTNTLVYAYHDPANPLITRNLNWTITLNCEIQRNGSSKVEIITSHNQANDSIQGNASYSSEITFYRLVDIVLFHLISHLSFGTIWKSLTRTYPINCYNVCKSSKGKQ